MLNTIEIIGSQGDEFFGCFCYVSIFPAGGGDIPDRVGRKPVIGYIPARMIDRRSGIVVGIRKTVYRKSQWVECKSEIFAGAVCGVAETE